MNKREKFLGMGFSAILGLYCVFEPLRNATIGSIDRASREIAEGKRRLQSLEHERLLAQRELDRLESVRRMSLPGDHAAACVKYQEYLIGCLEKSGLKSPIVAAASPIPVDGVGVKIHFTVQVTASSMQIGSFLDQFFATDTLHQISFLTVYQSGGPDSIEHAMSVGIEVLVIDGDRGQMPNLIPRRNKNGAAKALSANDIFRRPIKHASIATESTVVTSLFQSLLGSSAVVADQTVESIVAVEPSSEPTLEVQVEPKESVRLIGIIERGNDKTALFYDSRSGKQAMVDVDGNLREFGIDVRVKAIEKDSVKIVLQDSIQSLCLGKRIVDIE